MSADYQMALHAVDADVLTQYISDMLDNTDFVPEIDPTDIDIEDYIYPSYDLASAQPLGSPSEVFETDASVGPESTMEVASPSAKTPGSTSWSEDAFQQLDDLIKPDDDAMEDFQQGSASTALTPAAQTLRVASVEPRQVEVSHQPPPYQPVFQPVPHQPAPGQFGILQQEPIHPAVVQPQSQIPLPVSLPVVEGVRSDAERNPKKYHPKGQPIAQNGGQQWVISKLKDTTFEYKGYIDSEKKAEAIRDTFDSLSRPHGAHFTHPGNDATFPSPGAAYRDAIRQIFEAICDWSSPREWRAKMGQKRVKEWMAEVTYHRTILGLTTDPSKVCDDDITPPPHRMPPLEEQWKNVVHHRMSNIEIELLSAQILHQAMLAQQGKNYIPLWSNNEAQWEEFATFGER
ncbi:hypothetical protein NW762_001588 [Fusarium torreyae]|uniref:Uncharacterized protein n=1 Tax=Fusarium torreyae TaxID=1237075 RepID=A0A9W8VLP4_9HYPO|nr:hypothetical protein NW762_001588 [Fusarium torreyae]